MMSRALFMAQFEQGIIPMSCDRLFLCPATTHCQPDKFFWFFSLFGGKGSSLAVARRARTHPVGVGLKTPA